MPKHKKKSKLKKSVKALLICLVVFIGLFLSILLVYKHIQSNKMKNTVEKYIKKQSLTQELDGKKKDINFSLNSPYYAIYPNTKNKSIDKIFIDYKNKIIKNYSKKSLFDSIKNNNYKYQIINYENFLAPDDIISVAYIESNINSKGTLINENVYTLNIGLKEKEKLKDSYIFVGNYKEIITNYLIKYFEENGYKLNKNYKKVINSKYNYKYILTNNGVVVYFNSNEVIKNSKKFIKVSIPYEEFNGIMNINLENINKKYDDSVKLEYGKFTKNEKFMYVKINSNLYKENSKNSKLVSTVSKGTKLNVTESNKVFSKVKYKDKLVYILNSSLSDEIIADSEFTDCNEDVYAIDKIEIKKSKDENSESVGTLNRKDKIKRIGTSDDGWSEVVYNDDKGFIKSNLLSLTEPSDFYRGNISANVNPGKAMVAITFDDGPNPSSSNRILDTLQKYNAVATFFDLGKLVNSYPDVVKREEAIGCEVGTHTHTHPNLNNLSAEAIQGELANSKEAFMKALGHDVSLIRPPYGNANDFVKSQLPYPIINWNVDTLDWKSRNKDAILAEVRKVGNLDGKIILMHSIYETTADAVEVLVPELINQGYQLVTVSELAYYKGATLTKGVKYFGF